MRSAAGRAVIEKNKQIQINMFGAVSPRHPRDLDNLRFPVKDSVPIPLDWIPAFPVVMKSYIGSGRRAEIYHLPYHFVPATRAHPTGLPLIWRYRIHTLNIECYLSYLAEVLEARQTCDYTPIPNT